MPRPHFRRARRKAARLSTDAPPTSASDWRSDNAEAIAASNAYVEANGMPLAVHRRF